MYQTILCIFNENSGWRVYSVLDEKSDSISVVIRNGIKLLAIPVTRKMRKGHFCNPVKLLMQVVAQIKRPVHMTQIQKESFNELREEVQTFAPDYMLHKIQQTCVAVRL